MDTHWFSSLKGQAPRGWAGKALRLTAVAAMVVMAAGPLGNPQPVQSGVEALAWDDLRPPKTDINVPATNAAGFTALAGFGHSTTHAAMDLGSGAATSAFSHPIVVAPNGDLLTVGKGTTTAFPRVFKSADGGMTWEDSADIGADTGSAACGTATFRGTGIAVSPKYPSDNVVYVTVSDGAAGTAGCERVAESIDGGRTFATIAADAAAGCPAGAFSATCVDLDGAGTGGFTLRAVAISPDFDKGNNAGEVAAGGLAAGGTSLSVFTLSRPAATLTAAQAVDGSAAAGDNTLALCYSTKKDDFILARVLARGANTLGQARGLRGWVAAAVVDATDNVITGTAATTASCAFAEDYTATGTGVNWYVGTASAGVDNVFKRSSTGWVSQAIPCGAADCAVSSLAVRGIGSDANILAAEGGAGAGDTRTYRSSNAGSSWSTKDVDTTDAIVALGASNMTVAVHPQFATNGSGYLAMGDLNGAVMKTSNKGASWGDTGLSNRTNTSQSQSIASDSVWFIRSRTGAAPSPGPSCPAINPCEWFKTTNMGDSAGYQRVLRSVAPGQTTDFEELDRSPTFTTDGVAYLTRRLKGSDRMLKSSDGGLSWKTITTNPTDTEQIVAVELASSSTIFAGTDEGKILMSTDGGGSWTQSDTDVGKQILDFDLSRDFDKDQTMFVTAVSNSNTYEVWMSKDGGKTFTMVGTSAGAWGSGVDADPSGDVVLSRNFKTNKTIFFTGLTTGDDDVWRIKVDGTDNWKGLGLTGADKTARVRSSQSAPGQGDGEVLYFLSTRQTAAARELIRHYAPLTGGKADYIENRRVTTKLTDDGTAAPAFATSIAVRSHAQGRQIYYQSGGRILNMLESQDFLAPVTVTSPLDGSSVATNVGGDGIPLTVTWKNVDRVRSWDVQIALDPAFDQLLVDPTAAATAAAPSVCPAAGANNGCVSNPSGTVLSTGTASDQVIIASLVQGNTYYWRVRARTVGQTTAARADNPGGWSNTLKVAVSSTSATVTSPQPNLPLNGSQVPGLSTELSWNNPPGVSQVHVQVTPLNGDGPAINLILGGAVSRYAVPAPLFGTGPYVVLPGATYTWRIRVTSSTDPKITETDPSFGPWSDPRTFSTRRPDSGTIQLLKPINGETTGDTTPALQWKNAAADEFYYEVQLSGDPNFNRDPRTATSFVFWNLIHGGESTPPSSWTVADANALKPGTYYWRVRQRLQATPAGSSEVGVSWTPAQRFVVR